MEFFNPSQNNNLLSCAHDDNTNCLIFTECCSKYYGCFKCHDENNDHKVLRSQITKLKCNHCNEDTEIDTKCQNCNTKFGINSCLICKIWSNKNDMYHCKDCDSCCIGKKENYFHCNTCKICISTSFKDNHKCNSDVKAVKCNICLDKLINSKNDIKILNCGHFIHKDCYDNETLNSEFNCIECIKDIEQTIKKEEIEKIKQNIITTNCPHNESNCYIYAKCCRKYYECFICHDENNSHTVTRSMISNLKCKKCYSENAIGNECKDCNITFGEKHCLICKIWCNKIKDLYHCYDCDSCCIGKKENYFHCHSCKICLSKSCKDNHKCNLISKNAECPICLEKIFDKKSDIKILNCSHMLHQNCYESLVHSSSSQNSICKCTICKKSIFLPIDQEEKYDKYVNDHLMPDYYKEWKAEILCNDCCCQNIVSYHSEFMKCTNADCRSYNVTKLNIIKS